jgi:hypothetical protein
MRGRRSKRPVESDEDELPVAAAPSPKKVVKPYLITDAQWLSLWESYHKGKDKDKEDGNRNVDKTALNMLVADNGQQPGGLVIKENVKFTVVNRGELFTFLKKMGAVYGEWDRELRLSAKG